ncbi:MAG: NAD(P)/FAD-dependent oxidoreductase, partial [Lachnospiraceae bacterium]
MKVYDKIIIGAGASGMVAAIESKKAGQKVLILERMEKVGKKIFATGNGKCNMTNLYWSKKCYRSDQIDFVCDRIKQFGPYDTISFFRNLGLITMEKNGYVYPNSQQAMTVVETLLYKMESMGVEIEVNTEVKELKKEGELFYIEAEQIEKGEKINRKKKSYLAKSVVLASGGKASEKLGSNGSGYELAKSFGHRIIPVVPALTALKTANSKITLAAGVRCSTALTLKIEGEKKIREEGELQITSYGISGIVVFQISRFVANALRQKKRVTVEIDFFPEWEKEKLLEELWATKNMDGSKTVEKWLLGFLNRNLVFAILKEKDFPIDKTCDRITKDFVSSLVHTLKSFEVEIKETNDFQNAQVCAGGVDLLEITQNFESKLVRGLYLVGELLDVDGICGGYNLQWAFTSGYLSSHKKTSLTYKNS